MRRGVTRVPFALAATAPQSSAAVPADLACHGKVKYGALI
jgi:hypothetical protein